MPRPPVDLARRIKDILRHTQPLPEAAKAPFLHYRRTGTDIWNSLAYIERAFRLIEDSPGGPGLYRTVADRHLGRLYGMALVQFVENFERFLKEIAAACVDSLVSFVTDDRFNVFKIQATALASHFDTDTIGKSLCESATWLDCEETNERFRKLLSDPHQVGGQQFNLFPKPNQQPAADVWRFATLNIVWQIRHTVVHNVGVITQSDAAKLRLLAKEPVQAPRVLTPERPDLTYLARFLDETAIVCNRRVGERLAALLTTILTADPGLFQPQSMADNLAATFRIQLVVSGATGVPPPD